MYTHTHTLTHTLTHTHTHTHSHTHTHKHRRSAGSDGKESACNTKYPDLIPGSGRYPGGGNANPLQYSYLENPHGQRSLAGYSPWSRNEPDTTEQLSAYVPTYTYGTNFQVCSEKESLAPW